ncbi:MAG: hypothetical protein QXM68_04295 [Candidatus Aenigmatarchaeota archaeon]|nr:hypothetical protein [Candidatus Aenigmarchaeota archaeon]
MRLLNALAALSMFLAACTSVEHKIQIIENSSGIILVSTGDRVFSGYTDGESIYTAHHCVVPLNQVQSFPDYAVKCDKNLMCKRYKHQFPPNFDAEKIEQVFTYTTDIYEKGEETECGDPEKCFQEMQASFMLSLGENYLGVKANEADAVEINDFYLILDTSKNYMSLGDSGMPVYIVYKGGKYIIGHLSAFTYPPSIDPKLIKMLNNLTIEEFERVAVKGKYIKQPPSWGEIDPESYYQIISFVN